MEKVPISNQTKGFLAIVAVAIVFWIGWIANSKGSGPANLDKKTLEAVAKSDSGSAIIMKPTVKVKAVLMLVDPNGRFETIPAMEIIKDTFAYKMLPDSVTIKKQWIRDTSYHAKFYTFDPATKKTDTTLRQINPDYIIRVEEKDLTSKIPLNKFQ